MSTDRETTRIVRSWLEEGVTALPDRVLDAVLDQVPATPQRRSWWPSRRFTVMNNNFVRIGIAAAAVVALAVVGFAVLPPIESVGPPKATPGQTPTMDPTSTPAPLQPGDLPSGTYTTTPFTLVDKGPIREILGVCAGQPGCTESAADDTIRFTLTVPEGWAGTSFESLWLRDNRSQPPAGAGMIFVRGGWLHTEPCTSGDPPDIPDIMVGPTVDDFANALADHPRLDTTTPVAVTLAGYSGKYLDLQVPADISACPTSYFPWEPGLYAAGPNQRWHLWILDVDGTRVVVHATDYVGTSAEDQAELRAIVDSIQIQP